MKTTFVELCIVEPSQPFICGVWGPMVHDMWTAIQEILEEAPEDYIPDGLPADVVTIMCVVSYDPGETQYGSGYGDILVIPGYYMLDIVRPLQYERMPKEYHA